MGWRDWNQYQDGIDQATMEETFRMMASRKRSVNGKPTSLIDLGYTDAGLDDGWQQCGKFGPQNWTYHSADGSPVVDKSRFPNLKSMTDLGHSLDLTMGWYGNNCGCKDHCSSAICFAADVEATLEYGFDSIKLDGW